MCGRYRLSRRKQLVEEYFDSVSDEPDWSPRYNIAPTQPVAVIRQHPKEPVRKLSLMRWGLIPSWAKDSSLAASMINARSETASTKPAFRDALRVRRCLIPADGFYEWVRTQKAKQPFCFEVNGGELFAFAGLWDGWKDPNGNWIRTCSILTTTPNAVTSAVHDRMPVILDPDAYDLWLDPGMRDVNAASELLKPYDARLMRSYPVSSRVNSVANDDEECSRPVALAEVQSRLFSQRMTTELILPEHYRGSWQHTQFRPPQAYSDERRDSARTRHSRCQPLEDVNGQRAQPATTCTSPLGRERTGVAS